MADTNNKTFQNNRKSTATAVNVINEKGQLDVAENQQSQQPLRKSQRRRQLSKKLTGDDYAITLDCFNIDDEASTSSQLISENSNSNSGTTKSSNVLLESKISLESEQKGELKLKIKRVPLNSQPVPASPPILNNLIRIPAGTHSTSVKSELLADTDLQNAAAAANSAPAILTRRKRNLPYASSSVNNSGPPESNTDSEAAATTTSTASLFLDSQNEYFSASNSNPKTNSLKYTRYNSAPIPVSSSSTINISIPAMTCATASAYSATTPTSAASLSPNLAASLISPNSSIPMTRSATAKLIKQTGTGGSSGQLVVDAAKLLPPPQASPTLPKNLFNDEDDNDDDRDDDENDHHNDNDDDHDQDEEELEDSNANESSDENNNGDFYQENDQEFLIRGQKKPIARYTSHHVKSLSISSTLSTNQSDLAMKQELSASAAFAAAHTLSLNEQSFSCSSVGSSCSDAEPKQLLLPPPPPPPPPRDLVIPGNVKTLAQIRQRVAEARQIADSKRKFDATSAENNSRRVGERSIDQMKDQVKR